MATKPSTTRRWGEKTKDGVRQIRTATILSHGRSDAVDRGRDALMVRFVDISLTADAYVNTAAGKEGLEREAVVPGHQRTVAGVASIAKAAYGCSGCELVDLSICKPIVSDAALLQCVEEFREAEGGRLMDAAEAVVEGAKVKLLARSAELRFLGCHAVWELACRPENHDSIPRTVLELLAEQISSSELKVRATAAAAVWTLCEKQDTLARFAAAPLIQALLTAAEMASDEVVLALDEEALADLERGDHAACQALHRSAGELMMYPVGALHAVLTTDAMAKIFHRFGGEQRLLPLLRCSAAPVRRAVAALFIRSCVSST